MGGGEGDGDAGEERKGGGVSISIRLIHSICSCDISTFYLKISKSNMYYLFS